MTKNKWKSADARARFGELIARAAHSPQTITRHGRAVAVVLSPQYFARLTGNKKPMMRRGKKATAHSRS
jgi:prevent-host-death family protein